MRRIALVVILAAAAAARLWSLTAGVPYAVGADEPEVIDRAIRILRTGDWNAHVFDYPTLVIYLHACVAILRFLWGALSAEWLSLDGFTVQAIYQTGRFVAAVIGVASVWLTYRMASEVTSTGAALLAAAQIAVLPLHVRESHYILTDVPMSALTTLAVWLSVRALRLGTIRAYAWAGGVCGLAAAAKYNGGIVLVAVITAWAAWAVSGRGASGRGLKLAAALAAALLTFVAGAPYTVLDMPAFLDGLQFWRFAGPAAGGESAWALYARHLSPAWALFSVPLAAAGIALLLWRPQTRTAAIPCVAFAAVYVYVIASHSYVFGRYALPIVPLLAMFSSAAVLEIAAALCRVPAFARPIWGDALTAVLAALLVWPAGAETVRWLDRAKRADTRELAAGWLVTNAPKGTRVSVERTGPTYLNAAGLKVIGTDALIDRPIDWHRARADYLIISAGDLSGYGDYTAAGPTVFQVGPTPQREGPPIRIVKLER